MAEISEGGKRMIAIEGIPMERDDIFRQAYSRSVAQVHPMKQKSSEPIVHKEQPVRMTWMKWR